jgi:hypothetical protein
LIAKNGLEILMIDFGVPGELTFAPCITRQKWQMRVAGIWSPWLPAVQNWMAYRKKSNFSY